MPPALIFVGSNENGKVPGLKYRDEDILVYNPATQQWTMFFDGSNVGMGNTDIDDFVLLPDGSLLLSVEKDFTLAGFGPVGDEDVLQFTPTSYGLDATRGSYSMVLDGSQYGLDPSKDDEDIKSVDVNVAGDLVISVRGKFDAQGVKGDSKDLFVFTPGAAPNWSVLFDGSDVKLSKALRALWLEPNSNKRYLTTDGSFSIQGTNQKLSGDGNDIFVCDQTSVGLNTTCTVSLYLDMGALGMGKHYVDGLYIGTVPSILFPAQVQALAIQDDTIEFAGDDADEPALEESEQEATEPSIQNLRLFLPLVQQ